MGDNEKDVLLYVQSVLNQLLEQRDELSKGTEFGIRRCVASITTMEAPEFFTNDCKHYIRFHGGPCDKTTRAYPERPPNILKLPREYGGDCVYRFEFGYGNNHEYFYQEPTDA